MEVTKVSPKEKLFVVIVVLITSIVFGYTISSIGQIFSMIKQKSDNFKNSIAVVNSYLNQTKVNHTLKMRVRRYFEHYLKN
jgi:potassium voltage-gated channel Eag-related subfamily H protein 5